MLMFKRTVFEDILHKLKNVNFTEEVVQKSTKVNGIHHQETMNVCAKFYSNICYILDVRYYLAISVDMSVDKSPKS